MRNLKLLQKKGNLVFEILVFLVCSCKSSSKDTLLTKPKEKTVEINTPLVYEDSIYIVNESKVFYCKGYELEVVSKILVDSNLNNPYYFMNGNRNIIEQIMKLKQSDKILIFDVKELESNKKKDTVRFVEVHDISYQLPNLVIYSIEYNKSNFVPCKIHLSSNSNLSSDVIYMGTKGIIDKQKNDKWLKSLKGSWTNEFELQNWGHER